MRKKFILLVAMAFLFSVPAFAQSLFYAENPSSIAQASGETLDAGTALVTGRCYVQSITISQASTVGDYLLLYDATSATGTAKYDISVGVAKETIHLPLHEAEFGTGVFADAVETTPAMHVTIEYTD